MTKVNVMLLTLLVLPYFVNGNDAQPSLRKLGQGNDDEGNIEGNNNEGSSEGSNDEGNDEGNINEGSNEEGIKNELFLQTWINNLVSDPFVELTGCKLRQTENEATCGGLLPKANERDYLVTGRPGTITGFNWQVDCTEMKEQLGDEGEGGAAPDKGTFVLHVDVPSFKTEEPSNSFQCARVQYKVSCKPKNDQADCKDMLTDAMDGARVPDASGVYLIAGQVVDIYCDVMLAVDPVKLWHSDSRVEVALRVGAGFAKHGEKLGPAFEDAQLGGEILKILTSGVKFTVVDKNDPDQCYKALKVAMQWKALKIEPSTSNSATVRLTKGGGHSRLLKPRLSSGCEGCTEIQITRPMDIRAVLPYIDSKITHVKVVDPVVVGDSTQPPEVLRSALIGPPRVDGESTFVEFLRDIVIDPARLPPETKAISVTVHVVDGRSIESESIPIDGATGESIVTCDEGSAHMATQGSGRTGLIVAVILLSIAVATLLVMLWRKDSNPPHLTQGVLEMTRLEG